MQSIVTELERLTQEGRLRSLTSSQGLIDFSSNDYLGLARHPAIRAALIESLQRDLSIGSTGSRLLSGNHELHIEVEEFLATRFRSESALLFSSGYLANVAILSSLGTEDTEYFSDELNHASLIDGMKLSKAKRTVFRHNDAADLRHRLLVSRCSRKVIVTESVFSMDGDLSPLEEFVDLAKEFNAWLVVDEAHATGVFGQSGLGRLEGIDAMAEKLIAIHTCGKALGSQGAFVLSSKRVRDYIINVARPFIFTTALSPLLCIQIMAAVKLLPALEAERKILRDLSATLRNSVQGLFDVGESDSQITPLILGSNERVLHASRLLRESGLDVRAIRSPTVPRGRERLRISLKSTHSIEDVRRLTYVLKGIGTP
jgi:8-amino-7-oxononanoate synthase